jgi:sulfur-oxidizing protein SoxY
MMAQKLAAVALALLLGTTFVPPAGAEERNVAGPLVESVAWEEIRSDVLGGQVVLRDGTGLYAFEAPFRAHDAATVPVRITQSPDAPAVKRMVLVIDENPAPVAAAFTFGDAMHPLDLEMRIRIESYSNVRAVMETEDGTHYMIGGYIRAAGGCAAPAAKDAAEAMASLGQMRVRWYDDAPAQSGVRREAQAMLRHPNYSGFQRDQVTLLFVPARFVDRFEVRQGEEMLFTVEGGISISEDPTFRFRYTDRGAGGLSLRATDTDGASFEGTFALAM